MQKVLKIALTSIFLIMFSLNHTYAANFSFYGANFETIIPNDDSLGTYTIPGGRHSLTLNADGTGVFKDGNGSKFPLEWGLEIKGEKPVVYTARSKKLRTGTAYRIGFNFTSKSKQFSAYRDTHWPKMDVGGTIYEK